MRYRWCSVMTPLRSMDTQGSVFFWISLSSVSIVCSKHLVKSVKSSMLVLKCVEASQNRAFYLQHPELEQGLAWCTYQAT